MNKKILKKYASLIVEKGIGVKKGRKYFVEAPCEQYQFAFYVADLLYKKGASHVQIIYTDSQVTRSSYKHCNKKYLVDFPSYNVEMYKTFAEEGYGRIILKSPNPNENIGLNSEKISYVQELKNKVYSPFRKPYMANLLPWCIACVPNVAWAKKVFPSLSSKKAVEALWQAILTAVSVTKDNDPIADWINHDIFLKTRSDILNKEELIELHYQSENGTDFKVGLVNDYLFEGGVSTTPEGISFNANMPSEEIFSMPHKDKAEGVLYATKPLLVNGFLLENFGFEFHDGKVTRVISEDEHVLEVLEKLISADEGASRLGEVALVPFSSPINQTGLLFYNTLFDENASCHFALGQSYSTNMKNSSGYSSEEMIRLGANTSLIHVDFMVGSDSLKITGKRKDGSEMLIMEKGEFVF